MLLQHLTAATEAPALRFGETTLSYREVAGAAAEVADAVRGRTRVAVWATPTASTAVAVLGALAAGVAVVPLNPKLGERELAHIRTDSAPELLLVGAESDEVTDGSPRDILRYTVDTTVTATWDPVDAADTDPAFVVYTSGTTGAPKGVVMPRGALSANIAALADAWGWTGEDEVVHGLPLFHVHGLVLGTLGPLVLGGTVNHIGRFNPHTVAAALTEHPRTMMFGVPTMYTRVAAAVEADSELADKFRAARLLVSGSAPLPATVHERITAATGQQIVERYGMTETLMITSVRADGERRPGAVGVPLDGVSVRLVDDEGTPLPDGSDQVGEVEVAGPNLFTEYLNNAEATAEAFTDGWFRTGDMATLDPDGYLRLVGRRSTDLIKSGGYRIGAGEIENALLEHPEVAECAVTAEPDDDLGERIVAWIVPVKSPPPMPNVLAEHVANLLTPHKRPRVVKYLDALPRNDMGKVLKHALR